MTRDEAIGFDRSKVNATENPDGTVRIANSDPLAGIVDDSESNKPRVNEEIITHILEKVDANDEPENNEGANPTTPPANNQTGSRESFDPRIHQTDEHGNPVPKSDGSGFRKRRGPKPKNGNADEPNPSPCPPELNSVDYRGLSEFLCGIFFNSAEVAFGPAWKPTEKENTMLVGATEKYAISKQWADIPPGIGVCLCFGMYALPRMNDPETKRRLRAIGVSLGIAKPEVKSASPTGS